MYELTYVLRDHPRDDIDKFVEDHINQPHIIKQLLRAWIASTKRPLCDGELSTLFEMIMVFESDVKTDLCEQTSRLLPAVAAKACKRQLCSRDRDDMKATWDVLMYGISIMSFVFDVSNSVRTVEEACDLIIEISLIPILSRSLEYIAARPINKNSIHILGPPLNSLVMLLEPAARQQFEGERAKKASKIRMILVKHWQPTLNELRSLPRASFPSRDLTIDEWIKFGRRVHLYDSIRSRRTQSSNEDKTDYNFKYCHNEDCSCNDRPGAHKMLVCRGCWRAMYCNTKCQQQHWRAGHREACRPR